MTIYVGNLTRDITEEELRQAFAAFGEVTDVRLIKDKLSGDPRGFGFVEMPNAEESGSAVRAMNGKELKGRTLNVNEAHVRPEGGRERRPPMGRR